MSIFEKISFKQQAFKLREDVVLDATRRLLASKGFDLMTMDDVAAEAGIAKPGLYKHFKSKEDLVGEAMIRLVNSAIDFIEALPPDASPVQKLRALLEWALRVRLAGGLPFLPSTSPHVREMLLRNLRYVTRVLKLNGMLSALVETGQAIGELRRDLPADAILYSFYARTCDPAVDYLKLYSKLDDEAIVSHMLAVCFEGLSGGTPTAADVSR